MSPVPEPFEPSLEAGTLEQMRARLRAARWPEAVGDRGGWEWGADIGYIRSLCAWWAEEYDPAGLVERLTAWPSFRRRGIHFTHARAEGAGVPVLLLHGWPGAPLEFRDVIPQLVDAGHDVVVPSLPGFGFSARPDPPLSGSEVAERMVELMGALGYERWAVQGGDWGAFLAGRMAFDHPDRIDAMHCNSPGVLPVPADLEDPPLDEGEIAFAERAQRWRGSRGFHMLVHGRAPDALGIGLVDSPAALAGWLVPKYREWSDCDGELESRFSKRDLCDLLTFYWATGTAASALRLYAAEARDRWRLRPGERIDVPVGIADFPGEIIRPPRRWVERVCSDVRQWREFDRGGHFAALEEPELLARDLLELLQRADGGPAQKGVDGFAHSG